MSWPKTITEWHDGRTGYLSVPFTWLLPKAVQRINQRDMFTDRWVVGGPSVYLMPDYVLGNTHGNCEIRRECVGVLQRINPQATRTTIGCIRRCEFCGVRQIEGRFEELPDWPDLPILCDNNLLAAHHRHFDRVIDRLTVHGWCDFNQGLDARLLTPYHAKRIAEIGKPLVRLALDHDRDRESWATAVETLLDAGVAKSRIRSYVLCGFAGSPADDWDRCEYVESFGPMALPMWYHRLDCLVANKVTPQQRDLGWTDRERRALMGWYYKHRGQRVVRV